MQFLVIYLYRVYTQTFQSIYNASPTCLKFNFIFIIHYYISHIIHFYYYIYILQFPLLFKMWGGNQGSFTTAWSNVPLAFKFISILTIFISILTLVAQTFVAKLVNDTYFTVYSFQIWRIWTTCFVNPSLLNLIFVLISLYFSMPQFQKKYSTPYTLIDFFIQNTIIQGLVCITAFIYGLIWHKVQWISYGLWAIWMIYLCRFCYSDPNTEVRCWCFPFTIKKKYYPIFLYLLFTILGGFQFNLTYALIFGYIQTTYFKGTFVRVPYKFLKCFDGIIHTSIVSRNDFIEVENCKASLAQICKYSFGDDHQIAQIQSNNLPSQNFQINKNLVTAFGKGVVLNPGHGNQIINQQQLRKHWQNKGNEQYDQNGYEIKQQPIIIPQNEYQKNGSFNTITDNDSQMGLGQESDSKTVPSQKSIKKKNKNVVFY